VAVRAITKLVAEWFTPSDQLELPDGENPTRYLLKPLNGLQFMELMPLGTINTQDHFAPTHAGRMLLLRYGLQGWEGVLDENGEPLEFNRRMFTAIPPSHLIECAHEILARSALEAAEAKNS
jgi:hypothetical protein